MSGYTAKIRATVESKMGNRKYVVLNTDDTYAMVLIKSVYDVTRIGMSNAYLVTKPEFNPVDFIVDIIVHMLRLGRIFTRMPDIDDPVFQRENKAAVEKCWKKGVKVRWVETEEYESGYIVDDIVVYNHDTGRKEGLWT